MSAATGGSSRGSIASSGRCTSHARIFVSATGRRCASGPYRRPRYERRPRCAARASARAARSGDASRAARSRARRRVARQAVVRARDATAAHRRRHQRNRIGRARRRCVVGVVKSHRTLYARGDALTTVLGARRARAVERVRRRVGKARARGELVSAPARPRAATIRCGVWCASRSRCRSHDIGARADEVSRWILAEAPPVALPDSRWDKMVYGVRDCEEFLRAVM